MKKNRNGSIEYIAGTTWTVARCGHCSKPTFWCNEAMIFPNQGYAPAANGDLSDDIRKDYEEAAAILNCSPRSAAALLRLAIQKLCRELGEPGKHLDSDIAALVKRGLLPAVQQALDVVRVVGNNALHPGELDLNDNPAIATALFMLVNLIADQLISAPKQAAAVYGQLPQGNLAAIGKRDTPKGS